LTFATESGDDYILDLREVTNFESISILDVTGKTVYYTTADKHILSKPIEINLTNQPSGIYLIQVKTKQKIISEKIVLE